MTDFSLENPYLVVLTAAAFFFLVGYLLALAAKRRKGRSPERGEQIYIKGLNYLLSNDTDKAIEEFIRVTHLEPDTIDAYLGLGHLYRSKGDFDRAVRLHRSILARPDLSGGDRVQILLALGADYKSAGLWDRAVGVYRQVLETNANKIEVYQELAAIHAEERNWKEAFRAQREYEKRTGWKQKNVLAHLQVEIASRRSRREKKTGRTRRSRAPSPRIPAASMPLSILGTSTRKKARPPRPSKSGRGSRVATLPSRTSPTRVWRKPISKRTATTTSPGFSRKWWRRRPHTSWRG